MIQMEPLSLQLKTGGKPVSLAFVRGGGKIYLASQVKGSRWPSLILRSGLATILTETGESRYAATLVSNPVEKEKLMGLFVNKYGVANTGKWYGKNYRMIRLSPVKDVPAGIMQENYYNWLESEFDSIAEEYDHHIYGNLVNTLLRERSVHLLRETFQHGERLLEVGCGTGTETLEMLRDGHEVVAADISRNMLKRLQAKAEGEGLGSLLKIVKINAENVSELVQIFGKHSFGGIYSTYGALNCVADFSKIPGAFHDLLNGSGNLVLGIYNRLCLSEVMGYAMKLKFKNALSRLKSMALEGDSRFCIDVYAYSLMEIRNRFHEYFTMENLEGVPVFIPPSNFVGYVEKFSRKLDLIKRLDSFFGKKWPFNMLGDHFLAVLKPVG